MRKRILSLILAVCTVLAAVPLAIFPVFAASDAEIKVVHSTRFSPDEPSTSPIFDEYDFNSMAVSDYVGVTYQGGWQIGYKNTKTMQNSFTPYERLYKADTSSMILSNGTAYWGELGGMYITGNMKYTMFSGMNYTDDRTQVVTHGGDPTIRYTAEYAGTVEIDIDKLVMYAEKTAYFDIYYNGSLLVEPFLADSDSVMKIGNTGKFVSGPGANVAAKINGGNKLTIENVKVGDTFDFVSRGNDNYTASNIANLGISEFDYNRSKRGVKDYDITINFLEKKESYSSRFSSEETSTWPSTEEYNVADLAVGDSLSVTYPGAWQIGYKTVAGAADNFTAYTKLYKMDNSNMILTVSNACWDSYGGMYMTPGANENMLFSGVKYDKSNYSVTAHNADPTIRYTAEYTGTILIRVHDLYFHADGTSSFDILHNGVSLIGEPYKAVNGRNGVNSDGAWVARTARNEGANLGVLVAHVKEGDSIDFVSRANTDYTAANKDVFGLAAFGDKEYNYAKRGAYDFDFEIVYRAKAGETVTETWANDATVTANSPLFFYKWYDQNGTALSNASLFADNVGAYATVNPELVTKGIVSNSDSYATAVAKYAAYLKKASSIDYKNNWALGALTADGVFSPTNRLTYISDRSLYAVTATTGKVSYGWDNQFWTYQSYYEDSVDAYIKNGATQPRVGSTVADMKLYYGQLPSTLTVTGTQPFGSAVAGIRYNNKIFYNRPNTGGRIAAFAYTVPEGTDRGVISFDLASLSFYAGSSFRYAIAVNNEVVYPAGASLATSSVQAAEGSATAWKVYTTFEELQAELARLSFEVTAGDVVSFCIARPADGNNKPEVAMELTATLEKYTDGCALDFVSAGKRLYSAIVPYGQPVSVSSIGLPNDFGINGVYVNDSKVLGELPKTLAMKGNTRITEHVLETSVAFTINASFGVNIYVTALNDANEAGVIIGGVKYAGTPIGNGIYRCTIDGIAAKEIPTKTITYRAYEIVNGKTVEAPKSNTVTAKELLSAYMGSDDKTLSELAKTILHYGAAARDYFINKNVTITQQEKNYLRGASVTGQQGTVDAALLQMVAAYRAGTDYQTYPAGADLNKYTYVIKQAGLALQDTIAFAFRVARTNGAAFAAGEVGYRIRVEDENGEVLRYCTPNGYYDSTQKELLYYVEDVPAAEYAKKLYFTLVDANNKEISATLSYSVHSYLARKHDVSSGDSGTIHYLFRGIYLFGEATAAYVEEHSLSYDEDIVFEVGNGGDEIADNASILTSTPYNANTATAKTAAEILAAANTANGVYRVSDGKAVTISSQTGLHVYRHSVVIAPNGLVIENCNGLTLSNLVVIGEVRIVNCQNVTLDGVEIVNAGGSALTTDASTFNTVAKNCRIVGSTAIANAAFNTVVFGSYLGFTTYGLYDTAASDTTVQNCRVEGDGIAIYSTASETAFRFNTIKLSKTASIGIKLDGKNGAQNILVAQNIIVGTRNSMEITGVYNGSVVLNSAVSITANGNKHLYICDNALGGRLTVTNNDYLICDGNSFPQNDGKDHATVQSANRHTNGDSLMNVNARPEAGANEDLLLHVNKEQFTGMPLKEKVKDVSILDSYSVYVYMEEQAKTSNYVVVAPGAYVTNDPDGQNRDVSLTSKQNDTTIYAYGVYVETPIGDTVTESLNRHIVVSGAKNITFKGLTVGSEFQSSGQVYVLEKLGNNKLRVVTGAGLINEFMDTDSALFNNTLYLHRLSRGEFSVFGDISKSGAITKNSDGTMTMAVSAQYYDYISVGDVLTCRAAGGGSTIQTSSSENIRFQDITVYGQSGGLCAVENRNTGPITYFRLTDTNRPGVIIDEETYDRYEELERVYGVDLEISVDEAGRYRGSVMHISSIDATHVGNCAVGSQILSCLFENMCDDGTNQKSTHGRLASVTDNGDDTTTIVYKGNLSPNSYGSGKTVGTAVGVDFAVGDRVLIYTAAGQRVCDTEALSATVHLGWKASTAPYAPEIPEDLDAPENLKEAVRDLYYVPYRSITVATSAVNFDALVGYDLSDDTHYEDRKVMIDNNSHGSHGFLIENTVIDGTRSRGLLIKSSDGVVRNCTFRNVAKVAIAVIFEIHWGESSISERLILENNLIDYCSYSPFPNNIYQHYPIYIAGLGNETVEEDYLLYNNITIAGNVIRNRQSEHSVFIKAARDLYIYNNDFGTAPGESASNPKPSINLNSVKRVELSGNTYSPYLTDMDDVVIGTAYSDLYGKDYGTYPYHDKDGALHIRYQDSYTFPWEVTAIDHIQITSYITGTNTKDSNLLITREDKKTVYADGCGSAMVHLKNGLSVRVIVEASAINLFFVTGQSNASGDGQSGVSAEYSSQYENDYIRSPETMAYFSFCGQQVSIDVEGDKTLYQQAIDQDGAAIWHTDKAAVAAGNWKMPNFTDYHNNIPSTLDWETASTTAGCQPQQFSYPKGSTSFKNCGWSAALAYEFVEQTGERVWIVNASQGGMEIQHFLPSEDGSVINNEYYQAVAVFNLALETLYKEVDAGHFYLSHMAYYWFHGESNSDTNEIAKGEYTGWENRFKADRGNRYLSAEEYTEYFTRMHEGFMKDVKYSHNGVTKELEYCGIMTVRTKKDENYNTFEQIVMTGARTSQYYMGATAEGSLSNVFVVSNVTERWVGAKYENGTNAEADAAVEAYFLETYGSPEAFKAIFGYDMPTTVYELHPGVHYLMHGHNEMGMDCARNTLRIINARGIGKTYPYVDYAVSDGYTVTLVGEDGRTPYTDTIVFSKDGTVILPKIDPIWQGWQGVALVAETEGFYFDNFKLYRTDDTKRFVTFSLYVNGQKAATYTLGEKIVSSFSDYAPLYTKNSDGTYTLNGMQAPWSAGLVRFSDSSFHAYDTISKSGLLYHSTIGKSEHNDYGSFFVGSWKASLQNNQNGVAALCYTAEADGNIAVSAEDFNAVNYTGGGGVFLAILKNGEMVWPTAGGALDWAKDDWYFSAVGETEADLNELWANLKIAVNEGDLIQFCLGGDRGKSDSKCITNSQPHLIPVIEYVE